MAETLRFNQDDLTIGDLEDFVSITGLEFDEAFKPIVVKDEETGKPLRDEDGNVIREAKMSTQALKALVYILKRHEDPEFTLERARDVKLAALQVVTPEDPTKAEDPAEAS